MPLLLNTAGISQASVSSGIVTVVAVVGSIIAPFYARIRAALSAGGVLALVFVAMGLSTVLISVSHSILGIVSAFTLSGIGGGLLIPHFMAITMDVASEKARGRAIGLAISAIFLGEFLIPFVAQSLQWAFGIRGMFTAIGVFGLIAGPILGVSELRAAKHSVPVG
jgi:MFS family permease